MTLVIINTLDAGPHAKGVKVLQVRDRRWEMEIEFNGMTYFVFAYRLNDEFKHDYTRLAGDGGNTPETARERATGGRGSGMNRNQRRRRIAQSASAPSAARVIVDGSGSNGGIASGFVNHASRSPLRNAPSPPAPPSVPKTLKKFPFGVAMPMFAPLASGTDEFNGTKICAIG
jgi:hypothetical protein